MSKEHESPLKGAYEGECLVRFGFLPILNWHLCFTDILKQKENKDHILYQVNHYSKCWVQMKCSLTQISFETYMFKKAFDKASDPILAQWSWVATSVTMDLLLQANHLESLYKNLLGRWDYTFHANWQEVSTKCGKCEIFLGQEI